MVFGREIEVYTGLSTYLRDLELFPNSLRCWKDG